MEEDKNVTSDVKKHEEVIKEKTPEQLKAEKIKEEQEERRLKEIETSRSIKERLDENPDSLKEENLPPVHIKGVPYRVIDGKHVNLDKAEIIFQERKVKKEQEYLEYLKNKYGKK